MCVPLLDGGPDPLLDFLLKQVGFPPRGSHVRMRPVERQPDTRLVPPLELKLSLRSVRHDKFVSPLYQLDVGVVEEASHVGTAEADARQVLGETLRVADRQVTPVSRVVSRPDRRVTLGTGEV